MKVIHKILNYRTFFNHFQLVIVTPSVRGITSVMLRLVHVSARTMCLDSSVINVKRDSGIFPVASHVPVMAEQTAVTTRTDIVMFVETTPEETIVNCKESIYLSCFF